MADSLKSFHVEALAESQFIAFNAWFIYSGLNPCAENKESISLPYAFPTPVPNLSIAF
jgi:hypothetical protein